MKQNNLFSIILVAIFGGLTVIGFVSFGLFGFLKRDEAKRVASTEQILIWGTLPEETMTFVIENVISSGDYDWLPKVIYQEVALRDFENFLTVALARVEGPDIVLLPHEYLLSNKDKLINIPLTLPYEGYTTLSKAQYQETYLPAANVLLNTRGGLDGVPFLVDPLVLYYNDNLRIRKGVEGAPRVWSELEGLIPIIDKEGTAIRSGLIPLGGYDNFKNAFEVITTMLLQSGNRIVDYSGNKLVSVLNTRNNAQSAISIFDFYSDFADPQKRVYTWNSSLPKARDMFISERMLYYPGFASELRIMRRLNPNLVIRAVRVPQIVHEQQPVTYGRVHAFGITNKVRELDRLVLTRELLFILQRILYTPNIAENETREAYATRVEQHRQNIVDLFGTLPALRSYVPPVGESQPWLAINQSKEFTYAFPKYSNEEINNAFLKAIRDVSVGQDIGEVIKTLSDSINFEYSNIDI